MDVRRFKEALPSLLMTSAGDSAFSALRIATHGMSGIRTAKILNFACKCMDRDEFYVEVGTFSGYTLISAAYQLNTLCIGIDDFSMKGIIKPEAIEEGQKLLRNSLTKHIQEYGGHNLKFLESDFKNVNFADGHKGKLATLFIDGYHAYEDVKETMEKFAPYLSPNAIVVFDDVQFGGIPKYISEISGEYEMLAYLISTPNPHDTAVHMNMSMDEHIANGICVMTKKGNSDA